MANFQIRVPKGQVLGVPEIHKCGMQKVSYSQESDKCLLILSHLDQQKRMAKKLGVAERHPHWVTG